MRFWTCLVLVTLAWSPQHAAAEQRGEESDSQQRLERSRRIRILYNTAVLTGVLGTIPFVAGQVLGRYDGFDTPLSLSLNAVALTSWYIEPVLMLVADQRAAEAQGRSRSAANIAGWALYAASIVLPLLGGILYITDQDERLCYGLLATGAAVFLAMQTITDVLGTGASTIAERDLDARHRTMW